MKIFLYLKNLTLPIVFLLFLFLLDPYSLSIEAGYLLIVAITVFKGRTLIFNLDKDFLIILAFSITYSLFDFLGENRGLQYIIIQAIFPVFFYALGKMMITNTKLTNKGIIMLILIIGFIYSASSVLSIIFNLIEGGFNQYKRFIPSFWTGEEIKSTKLASYLIYNSVIPAILVANQKRFNLITKIILTAIFVITILASFRLGSRTLIGISIFTLIASMIYIVSKQNIFKNLKLIVAVIVVIAVIYIYVPFDVNSPIFSTLGHRLKHGAGESIGTAGNRTVLWADGLKNLITHPLGWKYHSLHHNLWLDMAKNGTIIPLIFFLINNVFCYLNIKKAFKILNDDIGLNITFFLTFFSTFLLFFTEPVIEGNFFSIVIYCLFYGILTGYIKNYKELSIKNL